jgi:membrane-associated protein
VENITELIQTLLEIDQYLPLITQFGAWVYLVLFVVVFLETGLILMSIFPGDSLLFIAGALAAVGSLDLGWLLVLALAATLLADSFNYVVGGQAGRRVLIGRLPFTQARHLNRTERYLTQSGRSAIVLARFIPWIRSMLPFVAGMSTMPYRRFLLFNTVGALVWVGVFVLGGFFFGNLPVVQDNLSLVLLAVVLLAVLPVLISLGRERRALVRNRVGNNDQSNDSRE